MAITNSNDSNPFTQAAAIFNKSGDQIGRISLFSNQFSSDDLEYLTGSNIKELLDVSKFNVIPAKKVMSKRSRFANKADS